jgi:hypothetical protein
MEEVSFDTNKITLIPSGIPYSKISGIIKHKQALLRKIRMWDHIRYCFFLTSFPRLLSEAYGRGL